MKVKDVIIIGAGPAGIAAAIQLHRQGINPLVFEKNMIGGLLRNANLVENYPGFPGGIPGVELVALFEKQFSEHSVPIVSEMVTDLDIDDGLFSVQTSEKTYHARFVIIASGTKPREFKDVGLPDDVRPYTHYEIYPILQEAGKQIAIVGAGDAAFDYALNLSRQNEVIILNRGDQSRCLPLLRQRISESDSISYNIETTISKICQNPDGRIRIDCITPDGKVVFQADHLVFAIGRDPNLDFLSEKVGSELSRLHEDGRLYCLGDVANGRYRQTAIAIGEAVRAAMEIYGKLTEVHA